MNERIGYTRYLSIGNIPGEGLLFSLFSARQQAVRIKEAAIFLNPPSALIRIYADVEEALFIAESLSG
jgi:hypothetical protein